MTFQETPTTPNRYAKPTTQKPRRNHAKQTTTTTTQTQLKELQKLLCTNRAILTQFLKKPINDEWHAHTKKRTTISITQKMVTKVNQNKIAIIKQTRK